MHCEIRIGNDVARGNNCDITMSNCIAMCTYYGTTMHNGIAINVFYYIVSALLLIMILLWILCNKNINKFIFDQSGLENTFIVFVYGYFTHHSDSSNIPTQTQLICSAQTYQTLTCSSYMPTWVIVS